MPPSVTETTVVAEAHTGSASPACAACSHPSEFHDAIATRFCAASASSALSRTCICKIPKA
jgi:hypothetical protein